MCQEMTGGVKVESAEAGRYQTFRLNSHAGHSHVHLTGELSYHMHIVISFGAPHDIRF